MELAHRRRTGLGCAGETPAQIAAALRHEGFTHLLLCPPEPETAVEFDGTLSHRLAPWLDGRAPVYRADLADADGVTRHYAIYELERSSRDSVGSAVRTASDRMTVRTADPTKRTPPTDAEVARAGGEGSRP
jgi:hypothetical protein